MRNKPYISVIIPTYNRAEYITYAIESVLNQRKCRWSYEVIVVDDGSTDNTEQVVATYKNKVRYYKIKHSGLPAVARNFGIAKARGELIAFQDSDDLWTDDKLAIQAAVFNDQAVVLSYGNALVMTANGKINKKAILNNGEGISGNVFADLVKNNVVSTLTVMARKSSIELVGKFNESVKLRGVEDYNLWLKLSLVGKFNYTNKPLAIHRRHTHNISHSIKFAYNEHIRAALGALLKSKVTEEQSKMIHARLKEIAVQNQSKVRSCKRVFFKLQAKYHASRA